MTRSTLYSKVWLRERLLEKSLLLRPMKLLGPVFLLELPMAARRPRFIGWRALYATDVYVTP